ncbi:MAG TPA: ATP-binding cassette domain-containing protein [Spirochaetia bacterium]|nr:ATP-binding cassette domain-containing protein [Spirochaetia bacterium]
MIAFRSLSMGYRGGPPVVEGLDLEAPPGRILALLGPSGSGKTTLLRAASGQVGSGTPGVDWAGTVEGRNPRATAMIFQNLGLLPWKTVEQNVELPLRWARVPDRRARVREALGELGLTDHARHWPGQLSGGLAQRVAIARALVLKPQLLLMDEPFSALDALTRERAQQTLWELWKAHQPTVILVTHSIDEAAALGHRVAVLTGRSPGRLHGVFDLPFSGESPAERRRAPAFFQATVDLRTALEGRP